MMADAAAKKAIDDAKAKDEKDAKEKEEGPTAEELAAKLEEEKKAAEEAAKKKAEAEAKAKAAAEKKAAEAKKAAEEKAIVIACLSDANLVLAGSQRQNPPPATATERLDYLRDQGIPEASIKAGVAEAGVAEPEYKRDAWGRIIALNDVKYSKSASPPPSDGFGQMRGAK